ncbi:MAG: rhomboid family intramembrane serine protease, partial [Thermofilaceae archaeon]
MGIPYAHDQLGLRTGPPKVTILLVVLNVIAYLATSLDYGLLQISDEWLWWGAFIPSSLADPRQWYRLFTSMFLHANLLHIFFNMIFLYNFGRLVETALGGKRYLVLYLLSGLAAEAFHAAFIPIEGPLTIVTPAIGASGAISGVLGAYLLLFPGSKLSLCFFYLYIPICFTASAAAYLIFWFVTQILQGYAMANIGVAVFAHAGGFVAGMALLPLLLDRERHRLLRALTASQRAFKYIMLGSAGLGRLSKIILVAALTSLAVGSVYSMASARQMDVPVKVLEATVTYRIYCAPQTVCDEGSSRDMVVLQLDGQPRLAAQISSDPVRIVYNRLEALGLLYDRALVRSTKSFSISRTV